MDTVFIIPKINFIVVILMFDFFAVEMNKIVECAILSMA
jgi:hypothetical protein